MVNKAFIFLTGATRVPDVNGGDIVICADSGYLSAIQCGLKVDHLVGDMDSLSSDEVEKAREDGAVIHRYPADKDGTDGELALDLAIDLGFRKIEMVGGKGGRLDHFLSAVFFNSLVGDDVSLDIWMDEELLLFVPEGRFVTRPAGWYVVSILPYGGSCVVSTEGLKWELHEDLLDHGSTRGIHNEIIGESFTVRCHRGALLLVLSDSA
jgi:thiamine pyrophosphokinase